MNNIIHDRIDGKEAKIQTIGAAALAVNAISFYLVRCQRERRIGCALRVESTTLAFQ